MITASPPIEYEAIHGIFRRWQAEQEPVAAQLTDSLAALAAYQSHLDAWQQQLAREREELRESREQFDRDRAAAEKNHAQFAEQIAESNAAREKIASLTDALLARTEELRTLDGRRAEALTQLELTRAREHELKTTLEELRQNREQERAQWADELRHLRELLERRIQSGHSGDAEHPTPSNEQPPPKQSAPQKPDQETNPAVLGSIVEQFGKLRQQRALDRPALNKTR